TVTQFPENVSIVIYSYLYLTAENSHENQIKIEELMTQLALDLLNKHQLSNFDACITADPKHASTIADDLVALKPFSEDEQKLLDKHPERAYAFTSALRILQKLQQRNDPHLLKHRECLGELLTTDDMSGTLQKIEIRKEMGMYCRQATLFYKSNGFD